MFSPQQDPKQIFDRIFGSTSALLKGGLNKGADTAEGLYNNFHSAAEQTGIPQAIGGATGALGGAIGGAVGGLGNFFTQSLQGKGLDPKLMGQDIANTARSTANFGYQTGKEGAIAAPLANGGKIVSAMSALPPARGVMQDVQSGNVNLGTGLKAGAAAASMYGAAKSPNWTPGGVLDPQLKALAGKIKDNVGIPGAGTMQESGGYNGYKNWDTWNKNLWLNNDEPQYRQMQNILKNAKSLEEGAQMLKRNFSDAFDDGIDKSKVDWMEIAKVNMEDMLPTGSVSSGRTAKQLQNFQNQTTKDLQSNLNDSYDRLMAPGNPEGEAIKIINNRGKSPGQIVNSMDDGLDTSSNYGENLMNNDGGASPSIIKSNFEPKYSGGVNVGNDWDGGAGLLNKKLYNDAAVAGKLGATSRYTPSHSASGDFVDIPLPKPSKISITAEEAAGSRYPLQVYQAVKGYFGKNLASSDIDNMPFNQVREAAGMSMPGGKEMFDQVMKQTYPSLGDNLAPIMEMQRTPRPVPGKWSDAYKRPMDTGIGLGGATGDVGRGLTYPQLGQTYPQMGQVSVPRLTPAQTGAVSKIIKQSQALKGKMGK